MQLKLQSGILKNEEDRKTVANAMETQVSALLKDRNEVPDENDEEQDANQEQSPSSPEPPPSPPPSPVPSHYTALQNPNQSLDQQIPLFSTKLQSTEVDLKKQSGTDRLVVPNSVPETVALDHSQQPSNYVIRNKKVLILRFFSAQWDNMGRRNLQHLHG